MSGQAGLAEKKFVIKNKLGIHARPAGLIVKTAAKFESDTYLIRDGYEAPAKSILGLMALEAEQGAEILVRASGRDAADALAAIGALFDAKFHED
jgi:phosphotransferase system HPr (HPr) family protein